MLDIIEAQILPGHAGQLLIPGASFRHATGKITDVFYRIVLENQIDSQSIIEVHPVDFLLVTGVASGINFFKARDILPKTPFMPFTHRSVAKPVDARRVVCNHVGFQDKTQFTVINGAGVASAALIPKSPVGGARDSMRREAGEQASKQKKKPGTHLIDDYPVYPT